MKYNTKNTVKELIHAWCNGLIEKQINKSNYVFNINNIEYKNVVVASRLNKVIYVKEIYSNNSFGNGYSSREIVKAIPSNIKHYHIQELPTESLFTTDNSVKVEYLKKNFLKEFDYYINRYAMYKEIAFNIRMSYHGTWNIEFDNSNYLLFGKRVYNQFLNEVVTKQVTCKQHKGWSTVGYYPYQNISVKIKDFFIEENGKLIFNSLYNLSTEEIAELEFKSWKSKFELKKYYEAKRIYIDEKLRSEFEVKYREDVEKKQAAEKEKQRREANATLIKWFTNISQWRDMEINLPNWPYINYTFIKKSVYQGKVQTSRGVTITMEEARKAYRLFKLYIDTKSCSRGEKIENFVLLNCGQKMFPYLKDEDITEREDYFITIGCHEITWTEAQEFVKHYNLNW